MAIYTTLGSLERGHLEMLEDLATQDDSERRIHTCWRIHKNAEIGDLVIFHVGKPVSSFVALGEVTSEPEECREGKWRGFQMADIDVTHFLDDPLHIRDAKEAFPDWLWLENPTNSCMAQVELADAAGRVVSLRFYVDGRAFLLDLARLARRSLPRRHGPRLATAPHGMPGRVGAAFGRLLQVGTMGDRKQTMDNAERIVEDGRWEFANNPPFAGKAQGGNVP